MTTTLPQDGPAPPTVSAAVAAAGAPPLLSVLMITYNHDRYVGQALDSALMQQTSFPFEVVVGEDRSTDNTRGVLLDYQRRHGSERVRLLFRDANVGAHRNFVETFRACRGKYVALLEGDDWWNDPHKLQKQVDLLERRPDLAAAAHDALSFNEIDEREPKRYCDPGLPPVLTLADLLASNYVPTCSVVFRNRLFGDFPDWYYALPVGDWSLHVLNALHGGMAFDPEPMATYRCHAAGAWSSMSRRKKLHVELSAYAGFRRAVPRRYLRLIRRMTRARHFELAMIAEKDGDLASARAELTRCLRDALACPAFPDADMIGAAVRLYLPALHRAGRRLLRRGPA